MGSTRTERVVRAVTRSAMAGDDYEEAYFLPIGQSEMFQAVQTTPTPAGA
jgi:hypothetical protein